MGQWVHQECREQMEQWVYPEHLYVQYSVQCQLFDLALYRDYLEQMVLMVIKVIQETEDLMFVEFKKLHQYFIVLINCRVVKAYRAPLVLLE